MFFSRPWLSPQHFRTTTASRKTIAQSRLQRVHATIWICSTGLLRPRSQGVRLRLLRWGARRRDFRWESRSWGRSGKTPPALHLLICWRGRLADLCLRRDIRNDGRWPQARDITEVTSFNSHFGTKELPLYYSP